MPPRLTAFAIQPATKAPPITMDQQDQSDKGTQYSQINHLIAVHWKTIVVDRKWIKKPFPTARDGKEVHHKQAAIAEQTKHPDCDKNTQGNLDARGKIDLGKADLDPVKILGKALVLGRGDDLVRSPKKDEPGQTKAHDQKGKGIFSVLECHQKLGWLRCAVLRLANL